jgi:RNA polymerase sigma-70 factor (ECF subfamily)
LLRLKNWSDQSGWQEFFDTYWRLIYRVALKAGLKEDEAQEVVQETLLEVAKKMPGFSYDPAEGSFKGWLLHTTRWKILAQFKRRRRNRCEVLLAESEATARPGVVSAEWDQLWEKEWQENLLQAALEKVKLQASSQQFEIFYLHVLKGQAVKEVARALEVSPGQVYLAKHRLGRLLRREIQRLQRAV